jgi:hypothetical protein
MVRLIAVIAAAVLIAMVVFLALGLTDDEPAVAPETTPVKATAAPHTPSSPTSDPIEQSMTPAVPSGSPPPNLDALYAAEAEKPDFVGTIAGIDIYGFEDAVIELPCADSVQRVH